MTMPLRVPPAKVTVPPEDEKLILENVSEILRSGRMILGRHTAAFEEAFATLVGTRHGVAVNSGTAALEIILRALDVEGHSVVIPTNTFFATPAAALHAGARVIFADVDDSLCLDAASVEARIRPDTKAIVVVHIGGFIAPQVHKLARLCEERGIALVEDAAHAHGATWNGRQAGRFGVAAAFSFYPTKVMTSVEGGIITTDRDDIAAAARVLRDQGKSGFERNLHVTVGYNWRMSEIHAAVGLSQLRRLKAFIKERRRIAAIYDQGLADAGIGYLAEPPEMRSNYYKYIAWLPHGDRDRLKTRLRQEHGVALSGEVYELPCHLQPVFEQRVQDGGPFPKAEELCRRHVCLPVFPFMDEEDARLVVTSLKEALA
jgi:dTDP-4-amino-4,6-dideoxygalactose transaminase